MKQLAAGVVPFRVVDGQYEYLLLQHTLGHWTFPRGKVEANETLQQAALREFREETGLDAQILPSFEEQFSYWFVADGMRIHKTVTHFLARVCSGQVMISDEHRAFAWLPYAQAREQLSYNASRVVLDRANTTLRETDNS